MASEFVGRERPWLRVASVPRVPKCVVATELVSRERLKFVCVHFGAQNRGGVRELDGFLQKCGAT